MHKVKYKDSRELPLYNYKRMLQTKDYRYMLKGYDGEDNIPNKEEYATYFNEVVLDYALQLGETNPEIINFSRLEDAKIKIELYIYAVQILELQARANDIKKQLGGEITNEAIKELLKGIKIPKRDDPREQAEIIKDKIEKLQNEINETVARLNKESELGPKEADIDDIIVNVALILEFQFDERKTSLYQFGLYQKQALNKIKRKSDGRR